MSAPIILGEIIYCEMCDNIKTVRYCADPLDSGRLITKRYKRYRQYTGICRECVKKNHYKVIFDADLALMDTYRHQVKAYRRRIGMVQMETHKLAKNLTPEFLEQLNIEAAERYRNNTDLTALDAAKRYVAEIKPKLIAYLSDAIDQRTANSRKFSYNKDNYRETEKNVENFLVKTKEYTAYCLPYHPFCGYYQSVLLYFVNKLLCKTKYAIFHRLLQRLFYLLVGRESLQFRALCEGKKHTSGSFFQLADERYQPKELWTFLEDSIQFKEKSESDARRTFDRLIVSLPEVIIENNFWK